ncbi:uncharacterized protein LOC124941618 [Impatiens glandulifera]|uniref:uncharacterized protein LOC124941618 n=1 Tax=Impatiens glandulifera TaxID=253017 RepID=UPI001FB0FEC6|nr:uncharacterized protein LOC124941618 [Impatiens glandulifera]
MIGAKRFGGPDSKSDLTESAFQNKRVMAGSPFDTNRAEPSQRQSTETPNLDTGRAELSRQHVRALNSQFASWVQTQLQDHPDELWEDGVQDYLTHTSSIMEKFSDVVKWLKANAVKEENKFGIHTVQKKIVPENKENVVKPVEVKKSAFIPSDTAPNVSTTLNFGGPFSSQKSPFSFGLTPNPSTPFSTPNVAAPFSFGLTPNPSTPFSLSVPTAFSFGNQSSSSLNQDASKDTAADDGDEEPEQPSSPSVKKTEEKGIIVAHEVKCKLYLKSTDPADKDAWKDRGTGQLYIRCKEGVKKGTRESQPNILIRNDVGKVLLNASLYQGIKTSMQKNAIVAIFHTAAESGEASDDNNVVAKTFLIRIKTEEDRNKLAAVIQEYAPTV